MNDRPSPDDLPTFDRDSAHGPARADDLAHIRPFRIGSVEVRPASREVVGGNRREVLEPRVMQVLVALAAARGETLTRDDLIKACWEGRAVTDDAINRVLSRLRALARDFGTFQVETITKVGYRLIGHEGDEFPAPAEGPTTAIGRRPILVGGAALAVAAVGGLGWFAWDRYAAGSREASIAVLPFANLSGDAARQYFADGMAEELRGALARVERLRVIGRTSSESVRSVDARAAAKKLGVAHILLGSVRQSPTTIRVSAQLVDGSNGVELWSETYDRPLGDVLAIQSEIAQNVARALVVRLAPSEHAALLAGGTTSAAAYDLMLKALELDARFDSENAQRTTVGYMDAAIALDPNYADAHAMRALRLSQIANNFAPSVSAGRAINRDGIQSARRSVELAPNLASGPSALGWTLQFDLQLAGAKRQLERAYQLGRGDARTLRIYATFLWRIGKIGEALKVVDEATALDPLHPRLLSVAAYALLAAKQYEEAASAARKSLQVAPARVLGRSILVNSLILLGRIQEARQEAEGLPQASLRRTTAEAILFHRLGDKAGSDRAMAELNERHGDLATYELATIHAQRGESDEAFVMLDMAWRNRDPDLAGLAGDRFLDPLRSNQRFQALVARLKVPD